MIDDGFHWDNQDIGPLLGIVVCVVAALGWLVFLWWRLS